MIEPHRSRRIAVTIALARSVIALWLAGLAATSAVAAPAVYTETPSLLARVQKGELPPVVQRVPAVPRIVDPREHGGSLGRHGGQMRWLMGKQKDLRMAVYYGYARLVVYDRNYDLVPDILERFEVEEARRFTLHLRPGHKWSDGHPFTAEDFRYWWEDVANNEKIGKGLPAEMLVDGAPPTFEVLNETTVRYTWPRANPEFLPALAATLPIEIALPSHYLKQFHPRYADKAALAAAIEKAQVRNAKALHTRKSRMTRAEDPELPVLDPWVNTTDPPSSLFVFARNPFYHRVDPAGRQLPYVDSIVMAMGSTSLIPAKTGAGDADLQARYLRFDDYTFLRASEKAGRVVVRLWERASGAHIAIQPNLTCKDPIWRALFRDVRVRRALSLGIDRAEINAAIFYGLARPSANTVLPQSKLYEPEFADAYAQYDPTEANRLLDAAGLDKRAADGIRLLPDGRRAEIILETAGESSEEADVLQLVKDTWREIGIVIYPRPTQRDLFRTRAAAGETLMTMWSGLDNGLPTADMSPAQLAPVSGAQLHWPAWGLHAETNGKSGTAPDMPEAVRLLALLSDWRHAGTLDERRRIWRDMLRIHAEQVFTIGIVNGTKQPVATAPGLQNVPQNGVFAFEPGGYFGIYHPETFWLKRTPKRRADPAADAAAGRMAPRPGAERED